MLLEKSELPLKSSSKDRKKMLQRLGRQIHQGTKHPNDWARVTSMGGFKEVGRSSMLFTNPRTVEYY